MRQVRKVTPLRTGKQPLHGSVGSLCGRLVHTLLLFTRLCKSNVAFSLFILIS